MTLTQDRLKQVLDYSPETGLFCWRVNRSRLAKAGTVAGTPDKDGYVHICIDQKLYKAHRLAWFYVHGEWPADQIDHINLVKNDNRIANLRECDKSQNMANTKARGALGVKGVYFDKRRKNYCAQIIKDGAHKHLGSFNSIEQASAAYQVAAMRLHREFARA